MAHLTHERLAGARERIVVGDRKSDIYALVAERPADTHLVVRCGQNRKLTSGGLLFDAALDWPVLGTERVKVAPRGPGDPGRIAEVSLRAGEAEVCAPRNGQTRVGPAALHVRLVEAVELAPPSGVKPVHWRLLTTLPGSDLAAAACAGASNRCSACSKATG